jgi:hypothetical protein
MRAGVWKRICRTSLVTSFVPGRTSDDPLTFVAVFLLVATVGAVAVYVPARQVTRIDPVIALRTERSVFLRLFRANELLDQFDHALSNRFVNTAEVFAQRRHLVPSHQPAAGFRYL